MSVFSCGEPKVPMARERSMSEICEALLAVSRRVRKRFIRRSCEI